MCRRLLAALLVALWSLSAQAATTFTGDKIQGLPVITQLDVDDLAPGKTHRFMFQGAEMGSGEFWYVPVMVAKGVKPGKRVLLVSGVHGDELNPIGTVQRVFADLDASTLSGSVILVGTVALREDRSSFVSYTIVEIMTELLNDPPLAGDSAGVAELIMALQAVMISAK